MSQSTSTTTPEDEDETSSDATHHHHTTKTTTQKTNGLSPMVVWMRTPPPRWLDTAVQILLAVLAVTVSLQSRRRILAVVLASLSLPSILCSVHRLFPTFLSSLALPASSPKPSVPLSVRVQALSTALDSRDNLLISKLSSIDASLLSLSTSLTHPPPSQSQTSSLSLDQRAELHSLRARLQALHVAHDTLSARLSSTDAARVDLQDDLSRANAHLDSVRRSETALRHDAAASKARLDRLPRLEERLNHAHSTIDSLNVRLEQLLHDNETLRLRLLDNSHNTPSTPVSRRRPRRRDLDDLHDNDDDEPGVVDRLRHRMDELTGRISSSDAPQHNDHENTVSTAASVIQAADALVPGSIVRDEVVGAVDTTPSNPDASPQASWPSAPETSATSSRVDGLPEDGGFAGVPVEHLNVEDTPQLPAVQGERAFAFSRDEFEKPTLTQQDPSVTAEPHHVAHDPALGGGQEDGQEFNAMQREDSVVMEDEEVVVQDEEEVAMVPEEDDPVVEDEESEDISDSGDDANSKVATRTRPTSYLESLERQVADRIAEATDAEPVESTHTNDDDVGDVNNGSIEIAEEDEGHGRLEAATPVESEESSIVEVEESENTVYEKKEVKDLKTIHGLSAGGEKDVSEWSSVSGESERTAVEDVAGEGDGKGEEDRESAERMMREAGELVKRGRRRGLGVEDADKMFHEACSKLETVIGRSEDDADMRSRAEGELGSCLVSWAKVNIADEQARKRLERAKELLQKRVERKGDDATALFNGGLCMCLLAATGEPEEARGCYEVACELYESLLGREPQSRIGCFNCGLTYISLGRIAVAAGDDAEVCRGILNKAVERFEKALLLRPGDSKAVSYLEECRSQLDAVDAAADEDADAAS